MSAEVLEAEPQPERSYKRLWCAMASAVVPGFGDWILGARKRSSILLALFVTVLLCYWPLRLPRFYWPFIVLILVGQFLNMVSGCCTFLLGRSAKDAAANGWIVIVIVLGLCSVPFERRLELRGSGFQVFTVPSESMAHTINPGDYVVVDTWYFNSRKPQAGEVVVFRHRGYDIVKRVVAEDAGTVQGIDGSVEVNGQTLMEPYAVHSSITPAGELYDFGPYSLSSGEIFVMGDNRDYSLDSRIRSGEDDYGPVFATDVFGKALYRFKGSISGTSYDGQRIK